MVGPIFSSDFLLLNFSCSYEIVGAAKKVMGYPIPPFPADLTTEEELLAYMPPSTELVRMLKFPKNHN